MLCFIIWAPLHWSLIQFTVAVKAKLDIATLFNALPEAEREALVGTKSTASKGSKAKAKGSAGESSSAATKKEVPIDVSTGSPKVKKSATATENANESGQKEEKDKDKEGSGMPSKAGVGRPKKPIDPEKAAKVLPRLSLYALYCPISNKTGL